MFGIDDGKWESPKQESSAVVLSYRPAFRGFTDCLDRSIQFFDEIQAYCGTALLIPGDCALNINDRAWWYSTRLAFIHHGQELAMQFFPRDGHCLARF